MFFTHEPDFTGPGDTMPPLGALSFINLGVRSQIKHLKDQVSELRGEPVVAWQSRAVLGNSVG